jgi:hypothetical protein
VRRAPPRRRGWARTTSKEEVEVGEVAAAAGRPSAMVEVGEVAEFLRPAMASRPLFVHDAPYPARMSAPTDYRGGAARKTLTSSARLPPE